MLERSGGRGQLLSFWLVSAGTERMGLQSSSCFFGLKGRSSQWFCVVAEIECFLLPFFFLMIGCVCLTGEIMYFLKSFECHMNKPRLQPDLEFRLRMVKILQPSLFCKNKGMLFYFFCLQRSEIHASYKPQPRLNLS